MPFIFMHYEWLSPPQSIGLGQAQAARRREAWIGPMR